MEDEAEDFLSKILSKKDAEVNEGINLVNDGINFNPANPIAYAPEANPIPKSTKENSLISYPDTFEQQSKESAMKSIKSLTQILPHHDPGIPNCSIIIHGLNYSTTQESLFNALKNSGAKLESARLVLDKLTQKSRGFAFCIFYSERLATEWVSLQLSNGGFIIDDFITRIEYCREKTGEEERADWHCFDCASKNFEKRSVCFRCGLEKSISNQKTREIEDMDKVNEGIRDIGTVPFHILLFRGLDPLTTEDAIWQNTILMCKPNSIWLVKDRKSRSSLGHCFVDFPSIEMANKLLNKIFKGKEPKPFYIENKMIEVSYAHMGSFIPSPKPCPFACLYQEPFIGSPKMFLSYWDSSAYCRPFPETQVDSAIPPIQSKEEYLVALQAAEIEKEQKEKAAASAKELKKKKNVVVSSKMTEQLLKWSEKKKEIGDLDELMDQVCHSF